MACEIQCNNDTVTVTGKCTLFWKMLSYYFATENVTLSSTYYKWQSATLWPCTQPHLNTGVNPLNIKFSVIMKYQSLPKWWWLTARDLFKLWRLLHRAHSWSVAISTYYKLFWSHFKYKAFGFVLIYYGLFFGKIWQHEWVTFFPVFFLPIHV